MRLTLRPFVTLALAVGVATCSDVPHAVVKTAPEGRAGTARFSIAPRFSPQAAAVYVGPGANATRVAITPKTTTIQAPGSASFSATAFDANNAVVPNTPIAWFVSDASIATLSSSSGASTSISAANKRGTVTVTAS